MSGHLPSCDTMAITGKHTKSGRPLFGKNSDRDTTEAQPLIYFPAADYAEGEKVKCTYIEIDQVPHTYAMIGSKPWWIWGFEHGVNEWGVAIGNEADWSTVSPPDEDRLLGMDLLRLGLERGKTAKEAVDVICSLLEQYGQGGGCQYGAARMDFTYHNSFMITDPNEVWLVETVDHQWVVKQITDFQAISNVYTIEEEYDACSKGLIDFAVEQGVHRAGEPFNFSKSFMLLNGTNLSGHPRYERMRRLLQKKANGFEVDDVTAILRDHFEGDTVECRWSPVSVCSYTVCMHGTGGKEACQTAASMVVDYHDTEYKELLYTCWTSMCPPCCSFQIPIYNTGYVPSQLSAGKNTNEYSEDSFWWKVQRMVTGIESNYEKYHHLVTDVRMDLEQSFRGKALEIEKKADELLKDGKQNEAVMLLDAFTDECFKKVDAEVTRITTEVEHDLKDTPIQIYRAKYIHDYKARTQMP